MQCLALEDMQLLLNGTLALRYSLFFNDAVQIFKKQVYLECILIAPVPHSFSFYTISKVLKVLCYLLLTSLSSLASVGKSDPEALVKVPSATEGNSTCFH